MILPKDVMSEKKLLFKGMPKLLEGIINTLLVQCKGKDLSNEKLISNSTAYNKNHRGLKQELLMIKGCAFGCRKDLYDKNLNDIKNDKTKYSSRKDDANVNSQWIANGKTYYTWNELAYENGFENFIKEFNRLYSGKYKINCINPNEKNKSFSLSKFTESEAGEEKGSKKMISAKALTQNILFGAPGTGKSFRIDDPEKGYGLKNVDEFHKFRTTFHPDYDYAQFVGAYKPQKKQVVNKTLNKNELTVILKEMKDGNNYPIHKFSALYSDSLLKLSNAEQIEIIKEVGSPESMAVELKKGIAVGEYLKEKIDGGSITYSFVPQVFAKAYVAAWKQYFSAGDTLTTENQVYLVIEEINRGNCAQIFGDIFQLLDRDSDGFSQYAIDADCDFADWLKNNDAGLKSVWDKYEETVGEGKLKLPPNLNILATMNTSDQSLFPMDSAFKRRFDWEYVPISFEGKEAADYQIDIDGSQYSWQKFVETVNEKILTLTESEDKQLGEFFIKPDSGDIISKERFLGKVMFYLWNEVCKDEHKNGSFFRVKSDGKEEFFTFQDLYREKDLLKRFMDELLKEEG